MVKRGETRKLLSWKLVGPLYRFHAVLQAYPDWHPDGDRIRIFIDNEIFSREDVQKLVAELEEWLAETAPKPK